MKNLIALRTKCPHCKKSFMDPYDQINGKPSIKVDIEANGKKEGSDYVHIMTVLTIKAVLNFPKISQLSFFVHTVTRSLRVPTNVRDVEPL